MNFTKHNILLKIIQTLFILILSAILLPFSSIAETKVNKEEITELINKAEGLLKSNPKNTLELSDEIISLSMSINYYKGEAEGYNLKGMSYDFLKNFDSSAYYYKKSMKSYENLKNTKEKAKILNNLGILYSKNKNYNESEEYFLKTLELRKNIGDIDEIIKTYNNLAILYLKTDKYDLALKYNLELLEYYKNSDDKEYYAKILTRIGNIHYYMNNLEEAIIKFLDAAKISREIENYIYLAQNYTNLGIIYYDMNNYEKSLNYYEDALKYSDENDYKANSILQNNIGLIHKKNGNFERALEYIQTSISLRKKSSTRTNLFHPFTSIAEIYINLENPYNAIKYLDSAEQIALKLNELKNFEYLYLLKSQAYEDIYNYKKSLEYYKKYSEITDSLMNQKLQETTRDLNIKYETKQKAEENKRLKKVNKIQITYFSIITVLIITILIILFSRIKAKQKANRMLEEQNKKIENQHKQLEETYEELQKKEKNLIEANATKDKFFSIIAHDLKNPINAITLSSETLLYNFKKMSGEDLVSLIQNINRSGNHLANLLENLLYWARAQQGRIEFKPIKTRINDLIDNTVNYLEVSVHKKEITFNNHVHTDLWVEIDPNMMQTVFRNLISNAIKFTRNNGRVEVFHIEHENYHEFNIRDNGVGISAENRKKLFRLEIHHTTKGTNNEHGTGLGLILCKEFIEKHGGEISVESVEGSGSNFIFTIPK
jgi:signal transduction histidine kinase/Tfp pilus assembly protein PilF